MAGPAAAAGAMGTGAGFMQWLDMFNPEMKGSIMQKLGLLEPNQQAMNQNTQMQMGGYKDMSKPPIPAMNMQQLMQMVQGRKQMPQAPQGLMAPPNKAFGGGLWD